eukprot:2938474-Pyramimonas_sp.AAC.1
MVKRAMPCALLIVGGKFALRGVELALRGGEFTWPGRWCLTPPSRCPAGGAGSAAGWGPGRSSNCPLC